MTPEKINEILAPGYVDFAAPSASVRMAWFIVAQDLWSARKFDNSSQQDKALFDAALPKARAHVEMIRGNAERSKRAEQNNAPELARLRAEKRLLENKPLGVTIRPMQDAIDRQIRAIIEAV